MSYPGARAWIVLVLLGWTAELPAEQAAGRATGSAAVPAARPRGHAPLGPVRHGPSLE